MSNASRASGTQVGRPLPAAAPAEADRGRVLLLGDAFWIQLLPGAKSSHFTLYGRACAFSVGRHLAEKKGIL